MPNESAKRPGGRSSRVKAAVFEAVETLLTERPGELPSMAEIAKHAGVNPTSLYRRWRDVQGLVGEVAVTRLMRELPVPDTGSLREDLLAWAWSAARSLSSRRDLSLLRIVGATPPIGAGPTELRKAPIGRRIEELEAMLTRGRARGEKAPPVMDVLELVLAPIYLAALFVGPIEDMRYVAKLVDRALRLASS
jgi:AcrR family transcriptional regulator